MKHLSRRTVGMLAATAVVALFVGTGAAEQDSRLASESKAESKAEWSDDQLASHVIAGESSPHTLILVDSRTNRVGVYHIDSATGGLTLKSVREVGPDLQMSEFNSGSPTPQEIREALQQR